MPIGAHIIQRNPSPLESLLNGLGVGLSRGSENAMQMALRRTENRRNMVGRILEGVAEGSIEPTLFATPEMQQMVSYYELDKEPQIAQLITQGKQMAGSRPPTAVQLPSLNPAGGSVVNVPQSEIMSPQEVLREKEKKILAAENRKFQAVDLPQHAAKTEATQRITKRVEKEFEEQPEESVDKLNRMAARAKELGINLEDLSFKGMNLRTAIEQQEKNRQYYKEDVGNEVNYAESYRAANDYRTRAVRTISQIKYGGSGTLMSMIAGGILGNLGLEESAVTASRKAPDNDKRVAILAAEINRTIDAYNKELKAKGRAARMPPDAIQMVEKIDLKALDLEENPPSTSSSETRSVVQTPVGKRKASALAIETMAQSFMGMGAFNSITKKPMTLEEARDIARKELEK